MMRFTLALTLLVGAQAFAPLPDNAAHRTTGSPVARPMAADAVASALSSFDLSFDPAVVGGIAASILGLGGVAVNQASGEAKTATKTTTTKASGADVSIPYDAAARLAYDEYRTANEGSKEVDFDTFQTKYSQMAVAEVTAKKLEREMFPPTTKVDLSIPYDAAARLAYQKYLAANNKSEWGNEEEYEQFKQTYEEMSVAQVTYKKLQKEMA